MSWTDALALRKDEKIVGWWQGLREIIGRTYEVTPQEGEKQKKPQKANVLDSREGLLVLTNQRLLFLESQDPEGKELDESVSMSLIDVDKVLFERAPLDEVERVHGFETHVFSLLDVGRKKEFKEFKKLLDEYCAKRKEQLKADTKRVIRFKID